MMNNKDSKRKRICDRIKECLELRGQTSHWLAEKLDLSDDNISYRFKTDSFKPYELEKIAKLFKLKNPWKFYFGEVNEIEDEINL